MAGIGLALSGCGAQLPAGLTASEVRHYQQEEARLWWDGMFPDDPMPTVAVVEYATPETRDDLTSACVDAALGFPTLTDYSTKAFSIAYWTCYAEFPLDPEGRHLRLSPEQLSYSYSYFNERTVPCLRGLGYPVPAFESKALLLSPSQGDVGYPVWTPYWTVLADPTITPEVMHQVLEACPPPPFDYPWAG